MNKMILIVEDNEDNLELASKILRLAGYEVTGATTAEEGVEEARTHPPDLILMDVNLPGMDGLTAASIIKSDDALKSIPIVVLTAYAMESDREKAFAAGCDGFLTKPINFRTFPGDIAKYLKK